MFVDKAKIHVRAGDGGNGCVSFRREKYVDLGGPDGGNGGNGGSVILVADKNVQDLTDFNFSPRIVAVRGGHGRGKNCYGRKAKDILLKVPIGTQAFRLTEITRQPKASRYHPAAATEEFSAEAPVGLPFTPGRAKELLRRSELQPPPDEIADEVSPPDDSHRELIADLIEDGQRYVVAQGGHGGRGNVAFKSSTHQVPREFEYGEPGEEVDVELELKTIADVGLVGYPNAGKSTLISKITHAHPKIAAYPFTTLTPNVGILVYDDFTRIRVADIPGLIEGAHAGKGLGHEFLRHIERCRLLIIMLDMAGVDGRKPHEDCEQLLSELRLYSRAIMQKPRLVVANKMDLPTARKNLAAFKRKVKAVRVIDISALDGKGLDKLRTAIRKALL